MIYKNIYTYDIHIYIYTYFKSNLMYITETTNGRNFHFRPFFELIKELILNYFFILWRHRYRASELHRSYFSWAMKVAPRDMCVCHPWRGRPCCTRLVSYAGAMLIFSTPKRKLVTLFDFQCRTTRTSTLPLAVPQQSSKCQVGLWPKGVSKRFHWLLRAIPKRELRAAHMSADSSSGLATWSAGWSVTTE